MTHVDTTPSRYWRGSPSGGSGMLVLGKECDHGSEVVLTDHVLRDFRGGHAAVRAQGAVLADMDDEWQAGDRR